MGQNRSEMGPTRSRMRPNMSRIRPNMSEMGPNRSGMGPNRSEMRPNNSGMGPMYYVSTLLINRNNAQFSCSPPLEDLFTWQSAEGSAICGSLLIR